MDKDLPIGVFDSGFGGLTVLRALKSVLPSESFIYFGDTARLPYGSKSGETILRYSLENAAFLVKEGIKALVVACHTASSFALRALQESLSIPVIGVTVPAIQQMKKFPGKKGVIATRATISSGTYQSMLQPEAIEVIACPLFVPLVEEGWMDHPITHLVIHEYLQPLKDKGIEVLLLGCTHYPLLKEGIQRFLGPQVAILDPGSLCAEALKKVLIETDLLSSERKSDRYFVSDGPEQFRRFGPTFLGYPISEVMALPSTDLLSDRIFR
ncbi:MAG: glutamate racemase [Verrucomicrobia bacterium]|nr:glutamate racemase [Verrucomicrobiota bacterium]